MQRSIASKYNLLQFPVIFTSKHFIEKSYTAMPATVMKCVYLKEETLYGMG